MIKKMNIVCPNCGKTNTWTKENQFRPFCSERCRLIDLGDWAGEKHRIAGEKANSPEDRKEDDE